MWVVNFMIMTEITMSRVMVTRGNHHQVAIIIIILIMIQMMMMTTMK